MKDFLQCKTLEYCREDLDGLRTREIKKLLLEQLGVSYQTVAKILDRKELKVLALELISKQRNAIAFNNFLHITFYIIIGVFFSIILFLFRKTICSSTFSVSYNIHKRVETLRIAVKERMVIVTLILLTGFVLQLFINMLQIYTLCTWILPAHILSRIKLPMISFPLSLNPSTTFQRFVKGSSGGSSASNSHGKGDFYDAQSTNHYQSTNNDEDNYNAIPNKSSTSTSQFSSTNNSNNNTLSGFTSGNYSMDIGPMITMYLCQYIQQKLETYATKHLLQQVNKTNELKEEKRHQKHASSHSISRSSSSDSLSSTKRHSSDFWEHTIYVDDNDNNNDNNNNNTDSSANVKNDAAATNSNSNNNNNDSQTFVGH